MAGKVKTWMWVVLAVVVIGILGIIAVAGVGIYFFSQHIDTRTASVSSAAADFEQVTTRFTGQKPLIELDEHGRYLRSNTDRPAPPGARPPDQLEVMAFDPDDSRIVHIKIPFWLLRMKAHGANPVIDFNGSKMNLEDLKLTVDDLERFGPTLVVDHRSSTGERVMVWSQ
jgi:hypothetical protein